jgi:hypothetical protein
MMRPNKALDPAALNSSVLFSQSPRLSATALG